MAAAAPRPTAIESAEALRALVAGRPKAILGFHAAWHRTAGPLLASVAEGLTREGLLSPEGDLVSEPALRFALACRRDETNKTRGRTAPPPPHTHRIPSFNPSNAIHDDTPNSSGHGHAGRGAARGLGL